MIVSYLIMQSMRPLYSPNELCVVVLAQWNTLK